jgi:flagellar basal body-associated protein FliL
MDYGKNIGKSIKGLVTLVVVLGITTFVLALLWLFSLFGNPENEATPEATPKNHIEQTSTPSKP